MSSPFIDITNALNQAITDGKVSGTDQIHYIELEGSNSPFNVEVITEPDGTKDIIIRGSI